MRKKTSNINEMSAVDVIFSPGNLRFLLLRNISTNLNDYYLRMSKLPKQISKTASSNRTATVPISISDNLIHKVSTYSLPFTVTASDEPKKKVRARTTNSMTIIDTAIRTGATPLTSTTAPYLFATETPAVTSTANTANNSST
ncbi:MAG: hypothetical protein J6A02_03550 [Prevotella sp.]|nr:hypothetical protein [Prevotella sp.]